MKMNNISSLIEASQSTFTLPFASILSQSEMNELQFFCSELVSWLAEKLWVAPVEFVTL